MKIPTPYMTILRLDGIGIVFALGANDFYGIYHASDCSPYDYANKQKANFENIDSLDELLNKLCVFFKINNTEKAKEKLRKDIQVICNNLHNLIPQVSAKLIVKNDEIAFTTHPIDSLIP